jgi:hypothetical protein
MSAVKWSGRSGHIVPARKVDSTTRWRAPSCSLTWRAADDRWRGPRRQEILRVREEFCRLFFDPDVAPNSADGLTKYFLAFAVNARRVDSA